MEASVHVVEGRRRAMLKWGAEFQRQKVLNRAAGNRNKEFLRTTDKGVEQTEDKKPPAATT
jgi:hypothetical protein